MEKFGEDWDAVSVILVLLVELLIGPRSPLENEGGRHEGEGRGRIDRSGIIGTLGTGTWAQAEDPVCTWPQADPSDEIGASGTQTPPKVLQAIRLVRSGDVYRLAHDYDETNIPLPFGREFDVTVLSGHLGVVPSQAFSVGFVTGQIGQIGTQFDGVGHAGRTSGFYNCIPPEDVGPDALGRLEKLGVETVKPFFTRAILLDFVHHSSAPKMVVDGKTMLVDSYLVTLDDVREVMQNQGVADPGVGDVVPFYTGWDSLFGLDNGRFAFSPGPGRVARATPGGPLTEGPGADAPCRRGEFAAVSVAVAKRRDRPWCAFPPTRPSSCGAASRSAGCAGRSPT